MKKIYFYEKISNYHILSTVNHKKSEAYVETNSADYFSKLQYKESPYVIRKKEKISTRVQYVVPTIYRNGIHTQVTIQEYLHGEFEEYLTFTNADRLKIMQWVREQREYMRHTIYTEDGYKMNNNYKSQYVYNKVNSKTLTLA